MDVRTLEPGLKVGRDLTIDIAKGIGILLVVIAHINYTPVPLNVIYSFHMPLFFFISGMLFRREKYASFRQFLKHRFRTLICPYVFFYVAALLVKMLITLTARGISGIFTVGYLKAILQMFLAWGPTGSPNNPLWFVTCLMCVECLYYFISKTKPWLNLSICTILVCIGWIMKSQYLSLQWLRLLWNFDLTLFVIGFYALGNLLSGKIQCLLTFCREHRRKNLLCTGAALLCLAALLPLCAVNGKISIGSGIFQNGFLTYATGVIGSFGVLFAAIVLQRSRFLYYLGRNTFAIMGTHHVIRNVFNTFCSAVGLPAYDSESILQSILPFLLVLGASLLCTEIYNRLRKVIYK